MLFFIRVLLLRYITIPSLRLLVGIFCLLCTKEQRYTFKEHLCLWELRTINKLKALSHS